MTTSFPGALDSFTNPEGTDKVATVDHAAQHANANDAIEALQAKVGADGSAVQTSHDYKLQDVADGDKAVSQTGEETLENKTLTEPIIDTPAISGGAHDDAEFDNPSLSGDIEVEVGSDAAGDLYYRNADGLLERIPVGEEGEVLSVASGVPSWQAPDAVTIETNSSTDTSLALELLAGQTALIWASGNVDAADASTNTISLLADAATLHSIQYDIGGSVSGDELPFALQARLEGPASVTLSLSANSGVLENYRIMYMKT